MFAEENFDLLQTKFRKQQDEWLFHFESAFMYTIYRRRTFRKSSLQERM